MLKVAVCGGGNLAHALAAAAAAVPNCAVRVLTRRPELWERRCRASCQRVIVEGPVEAFRDPADVVAGADLVMLAVPAFAHAEILSRAAPWVSPGAWLGALPAVGGFDILTKSLVPRHRRVFGSLRSPYNVRMSRYGTEVEVTGVVPKLEVTAVAPELFTEIQDLLEYVLGIPVVQVQPFLAATLCPGSTIFHPARLFELACRADGGSGSFYGDWGLIASRTYLQLDAELATLKCALGLPSAKWTAAEHYGAFDEEQLTRRIRGLAGLPSIPCPLLPSGELDAGHRFLTEDLPYGLAVVRRLQKLAGLPDPATASVAKMINAHVPEGLQVRLALPARLEHLSMADWL